MTNVIQLNRAPPEQPSSITLSPDQEVAFKAVREWLADPHGQKVFRLYGYAGTGKTTITKVLAGEVKGHVQYGAFTGKAANVMRSKGLYNATTLHQLLYRPRRDPETGGIKFHLDSFSILNDTKLLVVDEASMVGNALIDDIMKFPMRVLAIGDPGQLPPPFASNSFTDADPDAMLTEIHRQALDNPIIRMSMLIREGRDYQIEGSDEVQFLRRGQRDETRDAVLSADQVLVGTNKSRELYNRRYRILKEYIHPDLDGQEMPTVGEKLVCLKNNHQKGLFNGSTWELVKAEPFRGFADKKHWWSFHVRSLDVGMEGEMVEALINSKTFRPRKMEPIEHAKTDRFDFGYVLTCHKSQGSQWDYVTVFNESGAFGKDWSRWLYTSVTRAAKRLTLVE